MINELIAIQQQLRTIYSPKIAIGSCYISGIDYCCNRKHKAPLWVNAKITTAPNTADVLACDICDDNSHTNIVVSFFFREPSNISHDSAQKNILSGWPTHSYPAGFVFTKYPVDVRLTKTYTNVSLRDIVTIVDDIQNVFGLFGV